MTDPINSLVIDGVNYTVDDIKELLDYKNKYNSVMRLIVKSFNNFERFNDTVFNEFKEKQEDPLVESRHVNTNQQNSITNPNLSFSINNTTEASL